VIHELRKLGSDLGSEKIWVEQIIVSCQLGWEDLQFR